MYADAMGDDDDSHKVTPGVRELLLILVILAVGYFWLVPKLFH
jgi:hypothetical protein